MKTVETKIDSVTLYHQGATVRRSASVTVTGPDELLITGLPLSLADGSVRARLEGDAPAVLSNVRVGLTAPPRGTPEKAPDEKELERLRNALAAVEDRRAQLEHELGQLGNVAINGRPDPEEGKAPNPSPMFARASLEGLIEEASSKRVEQLRALRLEQKQLSDQLAEVARRRQLASTATHVRPDELTKSITVQLAGAAKGTLVLEYFVSGARWMPTYQCRMTRDCRSAELQLRAVVSQRSGEDWRGVRLLLSTASPTNWTELPELSAIRIGRAQPPPPSKRGFRPPPVGAASLFSDYDRALAQARASRPVIPSWQPPMVQPLTPPAPPPAEPMAESLDDEAGMELEEAREARPAKAKEAKKLSRRDFAPPPPAPAMAAPTGAPSRARLGMASGAVSAGRVEMDALEQEASLDDAFGAAAPGRVPSFGGLRLGGPSDPTRAQLTAVDRRAAYLESLTALGLWAPFDVLSVIQAAEAQAAAVAHLSAPSGTCNVRTEAGWYDYVYPTDATVDVPSDGTWHSVPVNSRTATGEVRYVVVPREDPQVYRLALVRNPLPSPLLPGPVEVYVAGEYVLTTTLPSVPPGSDFKLSLGVEQAVKVARNTTYTEQRSGDKVVATTELIHDLRIELVNNLDREATFEVRERIPQPAPDAEVVVDEGKVKPAWEPYTQEERDAVIQGGRRWVLQVKPAERQVLEAQYRVKLYANNELVGGNRRES